MKFISTPLAGAFLVEPEIIADERGFFARTMCREEFSRHVGHADFVQQSISYNKRQGTLRGLHYQISPHEEEKLVRVTSGAIWDVIVDLRPASPTFRQWFGVQLSANEYKSLYIPKGVAHGFQTLCDSTEVLYQMTFPYDAASSRGLRWDDPELEISWPAFDARIISEKDKSWPLLRAQE